MACSSPILIKNKYGTYVERPCRRCMACRIQKRTYYTMLSRFECFTYYQKNQGSSFITLTFDDDNLPKNGSLDINTGKKFIKRLREHLSRCDDFPKKEVLNFGHSSFVPDFKYYLCGEYGDSDGRPHYHAIIFGVDSGILSAFLRKTWKYGFFQCSDVSNARLRYVMKYIDKQYNTNTAFWNKKDTIGDYQQPFSIFSKGLGLDYIKAHIDEIEETGGINSNGHTVALSQYYSRLLGLDGVSFHRFYKKMEFDSKRLGFNSVREYVLSKRYSDELNFYSSQILHGSPAYKDYSNVAKNSLESYLSRNQSVNTDLNKLVDSALSD